MLTTTVWYGHKNRHRDHCNTLEYLEVNLHIYSQLTLNKDAKTHVEERTAYYTNSGGKTVYEHVED
jgi:hypothetical protein